MNIAELKEYFKYDPTTGKLFWNKRPSNRVLVGQEKANYAYLKAKEELHPFFVKENE